ncbi:MAG: hypothetical protein JWP97_2844 [Labilithrix sp.]|nr:hypothetical protein [Labilithrix sp.]
MTRTVSSTRLVRADRKADSFDALGTVLVADSEAVSRQQVGQLVARYRRVRFAHTAAQALALAETPADWCGFVVDAHLEGSRDVGLTLLAQVRERCPAAPLVVISDLVDRELVNRAAVLGAPILVKPFGDAELRPFLERVIAHEHSFAASFAERLALATRAWKLSLREHEILAWHLAGGTREDYLATSGLSEGTLKTYVKRMLKKVGAQNLAEMTQVTFRRVLGTPAPFAAMVRAEGDRESSPIPIRR